MKIAILGATSEIAKDLIISFSLQDNSQDLVLYGRRPEAIHEWLASIGLQERYLVDHLDNFEKHLPFDAIINFIGSGDPAKTAAMGKGIFDVTEKYDKLALEHLEKFPICRYIFISSGAVYGTSFDVPAGNDSKAAIPVNDFNLTDYYGLAKLYAECKHRSLSENSIVDIRLFNYFSSTQNMDSNYFMSEVCRAIINKKTLITSDKNMVRDFIGPSDFFRLIKAIFNAPPINLSIDCFSASPIDKFSLLEGMERSFGLKYEKKADKTSINATGHKSNYYSLNKVACDLGFMPELSSIETIIQEVKKILLTRVSLA